MVMNASVLFVSGLARSLRTVGGGGGVAWGDYPYQRYNCDRAGRNCKAVGQGIEGKQEFN